MKLINRLFSKNKGFTLIEIVVGLVIVTGIILAAGNFFSEGILTRLGERERSEAVEELSSVMEEVIQNRETDVNEIKSYFPEEVMEEHINVDINQELDGKRVTIEYRYHRAEENGQAIEMSTIVSN